MGSTKGGKEMRPVEIPLLLANLLAFIGLAALLPFALLWIRHLAPVALLIAGAQVLVEGPRGQLEYMYFPCPISEDGLKFGQGTWCVF
jgi:hypothetical protein